MFGDGDRKWQAVDSDRVNEADTAGVRSLRETPEPRSAGSLLTLISSAPNIIVGNAVGVRFVSFFVKASPFVLVSTVATLFRGAKLFRFETLRLESEKNQAAALILSFDETNGYQRSRCSRLNIIGFDPFKRFMIEKAFTIPGAYHGR